MDTKFPVKKTKSRSSVSIATASHALLVVLEDDLVDKCQSGDDICVTLVVHWRWHRAVSDQGRGKRQIGHATSLQVLNKQPASLSGTGDEELASITLSGTHSKDQSVCRKRRCCIELHSDPLQRRNIILKSVCPQLHGLKTVKLAFLLALLGGVPRSDRMVELQLGVTVIYLSLVTLAWESHSFCDMLQVAPGSVLTSGVGSTAAGLTAAAVKCDGSEEWMLDAGALVLADGGICCIRWIRHHQHGGKSSYSRQWSSRAVSFAKGSIVATLQTRCSVLGLRIQWG